MNLIALFLINLVGVWARSLQQLNVAKSRYGAIVPVAYVQQLQTLLNVGFAVGMISSMEEGVLFVLIAGTGSWIGAIAGIHTSNALENIEK